MNNAKMWLVVKPTVGIPLFLTGVAISSFAVHIAVLSKTNWYEDYLIGADLGSGEGMAAADVLKSDSDVAKASYALELQNGAQEVIVIMPDGTKTHAILKTDEVLASTGPLRVVD